MPLLGKFITVGLMAAATLSAQTYYPAAESAGGWRRCEGDDEIRKDAGMDPERLRLIGQTHLQVDAGPWAIAVVRHGYLVREWFAVPAMPATTFDVWSCTKSATGIAFGLLLDDSRRHKTANGAQLELDSPIYPYIEEGHPLSDPRKEKITLRHLLTMTSGIPGESKGIVGIAVAPGAGEYETALGKQETRFGGSAATLMGEPGTIWDYSDAAFAHLSLIFAKVAGKEIGDYMKERVFEPIGIENFGWDRQGGAGHIGPHTNAHSGLRLSARDFARLGYLMMHKGVWQGRQIVPQQWIEAATRSSQSLNSSYGYTFWVNATGGQWPSLPKDAFAFKGYAANRCYIVPSLDLVVVRVGYGPPNWGEDALLPSVAQAIIDPPNTSK